METYYILNSDNNQRVIENLTYEEAKEWLEKNGIASIHILMSHKTDAPSAFNY